MSSVHPVLGLVAFVVSAGWPVPILLGSLRRLTDDDGSSAWHWLTMVSGWWVLQILLGMVLGLLGQLATGPALGAQIVLALAGFWWLRRRSPGFSWALLVPRQRPGSSGAVTLMVFLLVFLLLVFRILTQPITEYDSLVYHLPVMIHWVQTGGLSGYEALGYTGLYPGHFELTSTLFFLSWGHDAAVALPSLMAWLHAGLAVFVLARTAGARTDAAMAGAALFLLLPDVLGRLEAIQPDILLVGIWCTIAVAMIRWWRRRQTLSLVVGLLSVGLLLGSKMSAPLHLLLLVAVLGGYLSWRMKRITSGPVSRSWVLVTAGIMVLLGSFWYLRNLLQTGNPAGLIEIQIAGHTLFPGSLSAEDLRRGSLAVVFSPTQVEHWQIMGRILWSSFGPGGVLLLAVALVGCLGQFRRNQLLPVIGLLLLGESILYWTAPFSADNGTNAYLLTPWLATNLRFGFMVPALMAVLVALALSRQSKWWQFVSPILVTITGLWSVRAMMGAQPILLWSLLVVAFGTAALWLRFGWPRPVQLVSILVGGLLLLGCTILFVAPVREAGRKDAYGPVYSFLAEESDTGGVVVVGSKELVRYCGRHWQRPLFINQPPSGSSISSWLAELSSQGYRWLVVGTAEISNSRNTNLNLFQEALQNQSLKVEKVVDAEGLRFDEQLYRMAGD